MTNFTPGLKRFGKSTLSIAVVLKIAMSLTGCATTEAVTVGESPSHIDAGSKVFEVQGFVQGVKSDGTLILVRHETIEGYMPSMTMPFFVKDPKEVMDLEEGHAIRFIFTINGRQSYISNIVKIEPGNIHLPSP